MKFSEKLIKLRKENKMSQEQLANMLDVSRQSVSKWESGQTYPEMDKLLSLCKIFKCSLDDLTNDEISKDDMTNNNTKKNNYINLIYEMLEFINKSISMLKSMPFKEILKMCFELFLLCMFLLLLRIPFSIMIDIGCRGIRYLGSSYSLIYGLSNIWELLVNTIYAILFAIIFIYIYKVRYLDKFDKKEEEIVQDEKKEENENKKIKEEKIIIKKDKEQSFALFNILGIIMTYIIKFIVICMAIPFIFTLLFIPFLLIIDLILTFKGVIFIGILLGLLFALIFNIMLIELAFKFIFNQTINYKKIFLMFLISVIGIGISIGIFTIEVSRVKFIDESPKELETKTITKEFKMKDNSFIYYLNYYIVKCSTYDDNDCNYIINHAGDEVTYNYDENLKDTVKVEIIYNKDFVTSDIVEKEDGSIEISYERLDEYNTFINTLNIIISNLKSRKIYNYDYLDNITIKITTSEKNAKILEKNLKERARMEMEIHRQNKYYEYEQKISNLEEEISILNDKIYELEDDYSILEIEKNDEIAELNNQIEEYEDKIQEYKDRIADLLTE